MSFLCRRIITNAQNILKRGQSVCNVKNILNGSPLCTQRFYSNATPYEVIDPKKDKIASLETINRIKDQIAQRQEGRLFAVVHLAGKQFKITEGDVIVVEGYWPPDVGDKISLDKVLLVGAQDFSLIGRPLIERGLVSIQATIIEKTLSHTKTHFRKKRRKQYKQINFYRIPHTMVRINKVEIVGELNNPPDVTGLQNSSN